MSCLPCDAGIPYYDNMILWCNNSAKWWPEIPVFVAILLATLIMGYICYFVFQNEKQSQRHSCRGDMYITKMVFKQSCLFIGAFYVTWVPYLALQYMWSSGKAFWYYRFILYAGSTVPLQGFWNFIVYCVPRYFQNNPNPNSTLRIDTEL